MEETVMFIQVNRWSKFPLDHPFLSTVLQVRGVFLKSCSAEQIAWSNGQLLPPFHPAKFLGESNGKHIEKRLTHSTPLNFLNFKRVGRKRRECIFSVQLP